MVFVDSSTTTTTTTTTTSGEEPSVSLDVKCRVAAAFVASSCSLRCISETQIEHLLNLVV
jgi:hypothetical protein